MLEFVINCKVMPKEHPPITSDWSDWSTLTKLTGCMIVFFEFLPYTSLEIDIKRFSYLHPLKILKFFKFLQKSKGAILLCQKSKSKQNTKPQGEDTFLLPWIVFLLNSADEVQTHLRVWTGLRMSQNFLMKKTLKI